MPHLKMCLLKIFFSTLKEFLMVLATNFMLIMPKLWRPPHPTHTVLLKHFKVRHLQTAMQTRLNSY